MLVLDENRPAGQRRLLRSWRIRFRVIGVDVASRGADDADLLPAHPFESALIGAPSLAALGKQLWRQPTGYTDSPMRAAIMTISWTDPFPISKHRAEAETR